jgi:hypothetical protein
MEYSGKINGTFRAERTFKEHSGNNAVTSNQRLSRLKEPGEFKNVQRTLMEHSGNIQGTFREHSGNNAETSDPRLPLLKKRVSEETFGEHSPLMENSWNIQEHLGNIQGTCREHSGNIQGTFREHSGINVCVASSLTVVSVKYNIVTILKLYVRYSFNTLCYR